EVAQVNPRYPGVHVNLGNLHLIRENYAQAASEYTQALAQDPYVASAHLNLALLLFREGKPDDARTHYLEAQDLDPKYRGYFPELE
ncbi:MAG TPA: tetratricopeptide repeat protein, partial [bacterium]|nr:tetratricopeptide repeat protein [bacterium]